MRQGAGGEQISSKSNNFHFKILVVCKCCAKFLNAIFHALAQDNLIINECWYE
jgi:hypothetical protein